MFRSLSNSWGNITQLFVPGQAQSCAGKRRRSALYQQFANEEELHGVPTLSACVL